MSQAAYDTSFSSGSRVDEKARMIRGVSVMQAGEMPDRGQFVDGKSLTMLKACCEKFPNGVKVKMDHGGGIADVAGMLRNFRIDGDVLRADLHFLDTEENADKIMEMAREIPDTFGMSVSVEQTLEEGNGRLSIRPTAVFSVDLVTDPAACPTGLFSTRRVDAITKNKSMNPEDILKQLTAINEKLTGLETRVGNFEKQKADSTTDFSAKLTTFETELKSVRETFTANLDKNNAALVKSVAEEFSKTIGTTVVKAQLVDAAKKEGADDTKPGEAFEALVQAEFAKNGGSKTKAMSSAIAADLASTKGKGHQAFIAAARSVNYSKKS